MCISEVLVCPPEPETAPAVLTNSLNLPYHQWGKAVADLCNSLPCLGVAERKSQRRKELWQPGGLGGSSGAAAEVGRATFTPLLMFILFFFFFKGSPHPDIPYI